MAKGIKINFDVDDDIYEVYTSNNSQGDFVLYSNNIIQDSIIISGSPLSNANNILYVKLITNKNDRIITITIEKPTDFIVLTPTLTRTPTKTPTPTKTTGLTPTPTSTTGLTPTPTSTIGGTPTTTPTITPTPSTTPPYVDIFNTSSLVYTSYEEFSDTNGNIGVLKYYNNLTDLYNSIMIETNRVSNILENVKTDNTNGIVVGAKIYSTSNVLFNITGYMCYINNNVFKYIKIVNSIITEIGNLVAPSSITGTTILFPYYTTGNDDPSGTSTGWGYLEGYGYWLHRLNINNDGLTLIYQLRGGNFDSQINSSGSFIFQYDGVNYICKPYFTINRRTKNYGLPNSYVIPNMYRGTLIELIISIEVTQQTPATITKEIALIMENIRREFNISYNILIGK
jgi:hypothetical protein